MQTAMHYFELLANVEAKQIPRYRMKKSPQFKSKFIQSLKGKRKMIKKVIGLHSKWLTKQMIAVLVLSAGALAGFAPSAFAIEPCDSAQLIPVNTVSGVKNLTPGARQFYRVNAPSSGLLTLFALGATDTTGQLYDKDCLPINGAIDYYDGPDANFLISWPVVQAPYFLEVFGNSSSTQGAYRIQTEGDFASDDHGVMCNSATVARSLTEPGALTPYGDRDFFQINVKGGTGTVTIFTEGATDTTGRLYDKNCLYINGSIDYYNGPDNNFQITQTLSPGIYYVEVSGNNSDTKGGYNLRLSGDVVFPAGTCAGKTATISGTTGNDVIRGTAGNDVIQAFEGNDVIYGLAGNDTLCGGLGDDVIQGSDGADNLIGETGNDVLQGGNQNDTLNGGPGSDICDGGDFADTATACEVTNLVP